jgi:regulator of replication initiation timing
MKLKESDITPKYVSDKLESLGQALFDSIHEFEERLKEQEKHIVTLKQKIRELENEE